MATLKESEYTKTVKQMILGKKIAEMKLNGKHFKFSDKQSDFISTMDGSQTKFVLASGGRGCGKSLALIFKMYLMCKGFPGIRILLGRKNLSDIEKTTLQDFFKIVPAREFEYRLKDGIINFRNGSQIVLMGLDAMQSGNIGDMKKAQQKTKSLNIGAYFIDQLEEIEYDVFQSLGDTMRQVSPEMSEFLSTAIPEIRLAVAQMTTAEILQYFEVLDYPRQGNMTCNPANFWAYHYFKLNERRDEDGNWLPKTASDSLLLESSMLDNKDNLPPDFVRDRMSREESFVRRMVYGEWNMDVLTKGAVFAKEHIRHLESYVHPPLKMEEGCEIYEEPSGLEYRMGVDPSEGVVDPSSIVVVDFSGRVVAFFNGMIPIQALADKVKFLFYKYKRPLIIPESNAAGAALIREIRDLRVYARKTLDERHDTEKDKLGFRTSWDSKQQLIEHFQKLLRAKIPKIPVRKTIEEMKVFVYSDQASSQGAGASRGFHDDSIMATMLAYWDWTPRKAEAILAVRTRQSTPKRFQYN